MSEKSFTLLELIVVIIIIGILGTLGFVQYNNALERSRAVEGISFLGSLRKAQTGYYLENGQYLFAQGANALQPLGIDFGSFKYFDNSISCTNTNPTTDYCQVHRNLTIPTAYFLYINLSSGKISCNDVAGGQVCRTIGY